MDILTTVNAFRVMADLIEADGYAPTAGESGALNLNAAADRAADMVSAFTDEIEDAFCGWLQLRGLLPAGVPSWCTAGGKVDLWETERGGRSQAEVLRELRAAADALSLVMSLSA